MDVEMPQIPPRLRADAQDNRDRILAAARTLFTERGLDVGMREIARHAEVGPATLYRRFPTKQTLVEATFDVELRSCQQIVEDGSADTDPWRGFAYVVEHITALNVSNRGFVDAFMSSDPSTSPFAGHRQHLLRLLDELARRAQQAGALRSDFVIDDLVLVLLAGRGLSAVAPSGRQRAAQRFAALAIDAFREGRSDAIGS